MGFSVLAVNNYLNPGTPRQHSDVWLHNSNRTCVQQVRACEPIGDGMTYLLSFYGAPSMEFTVPNSGSSIFTLQYSRPTLLEQTPRKHVASSFVPKNTLLVTSDGIFEVTNAKIDTITINKADGKKESDVRVLKVKSDTAYGERLFLYRIGHDGLLTACLQHQTILAVYAKPAYHYIPKELLATSVDFYVPPLTAEAYKSEYDFIIGMGEKFAKTAKQMANNSIVDTKVIQALQAIRDQHGCDLNVSSEQKRMWALSQHVGTQQANKVVAFTTVTKAPPAVVPKKATVDREWLIGVLQSITSKSKLPLSEV